MLNNRKRKILKWLLILMAAIVFTTVYTMFDPAQNAWFPKCPFKAMTGLKCPGCGSQRAVHAILNLDIKEALRYNVLLVISIPYLVTGFIFDFKKELTPRQAKWRKALFGPRAIWVIFWIVIIFWIMRNVI